MLDCEILLDEVNIAITFNHFANFLLAFGFCTSYAVGRKIGVKMCIEFSLHKWCHKFELLHDLEEEMSLI